MADYPTSGMSFKRAWDFDGAARQLSTVDLDQAGDPESDFGEALLAVLSGVGITVGAPTLATQGGQPQVKIGVAGGGTPLGVADAAIIDLADVATAQRHGYILAAPGGGVEVGASSETTPATIAVVILTNGIQLKKVTSVEDDLIIKDNLTLNETARIDAGSGEISSPTIVSLASAIAAVGSNAYARVEGEPQMFSGDIQPSHAVDGDMWGRAEPL